MVQAQRCTVRFAKGRWPPARLCRSPRVLLQRHVLIVTVLLGVYVMASVLLVNTSSSGSGQAEKSQHLAQDRSTLANLVEEKNDNPDTDSSAEKVAARGAGPEPVHHEPKVNSNTKVKGDSSTTPVVFHFLQSTRVQESVIEHEDKPNISMEVERLVKQFRLRQDDTLRGQGDAKGYGQGRAVWSITDSWPTDRDLFPDPAPELGEVLRALARAPIESADTADGGTAAKMIFTLAGGQKVLFKPKTYSRDKVWTKADLCAMRDTHNGEIATFHLARILGFRKAPLSVGRMVNLRREVLPVATHRLRKTARNYGPSSTCLLGRQGICTSNDLVEGAVILWLPRHLTFQQSEHPWGGVCRAMEEKEFQFYLPGITSSREICPAASTWGPFRENPALFLDLIEAAIVQYLTANADRKMYIGTGSFSNLLPLMDSGKSFADPAKDVKEILAPLSHCCVVRNSTYHHLLRFKDGVLSDVFDQVTSDDPVYPILSPSNLAALDRRLQKVLEEIDICVKTHGEDKVLLSGVSYSVKEFSGKGFGVDLT